MYVYLVLLELPVDQQCGLFVHFLCDGVSHGVVRLQASVEACAAVLVVYVLLGVSGGRRQHKVSCSDVHALAHDGHAAAAFRGLFQHRCSDFHASMRTRVQCLLRYDTFVVVAVFFVTATFLHDVEEERSLTLTLHSLCTVYV